MSEIDVLRYIQDGATFNWIRDFIFSDPNLSEDKKNMLLNAAARAIL